MKEIILATANPGKIRELQSILSPVHCILQQQLGIESVEETGVSFVENALIKARHASKIGGKPALADDSGLVVEALNGAPGIYSARFAGENATDDENINLLLAELENLPESKRQAYYYCSIVLVMHPNDPTPIIATGKWPGTIGFERMGQQGFGYDPLFYVEEYQCTAAELSQEIKNRISHRAQALQHLKEQIKL